MKLYIWGVLPLLLVLSLSDGGFGASFEVEPCEPEKCKEFCKKNAKGRTVLREACVVEECQCTYRAQVNGQASPAPTPEAGSKAPGAVVVSKEIPAAATAAVTKARALTSGKQTDARKTSDKPATASDAPASQTDETPKEDTTPEKAKRDTAKEEKSKTGSEASGNGTSVQNANSRKRKSADEEDEEDDEGKSGDTASTTKPKAEHTSTEPSKPSEKVTGGRGSVKENSHDEHASNSEGSQRGGKSDGATTPKGSGTPKPTTLSASSKQGSEVSPSGTPTDGEATPSASEPSKSSSSDSEEEKSVDKRSATTKAATTTEKLIHNGESDKQLKPLLPLLPAARGMSSGIGDALKPLDDAESKKSKDSMLPFHDLSFF